MTDPGEGTGPGAGSDDDRSLVVTGGLTFNEASTYATFKVTGQEGFAVNLVLGNTAATTDRDADTSGFTLSYSTDGGSSWTNYTWNGTSGNRPTVPAGGEILVRVNITSEQDSPAVYEGAETFTLTASYATNANITSSAIDSIIDDGTGRIDNNGDGDVTDPGEGTGPGVGFDDDRSINVTAYGPVNEASQYAMFTVTATPNQQLDLTLQAATSGTAATRTGFTIEYSTDGIHWTTYDATHKPTAPSNGKVYVRVDIRSESDTEYEISETFALKASFTNTPAISGAADTSIVDDGTGTKYGPDVDPTSGPATDTIGLDDDRPKAAPPPPPAPPPAPPAPPAPLVPPPPPPASPPAFASALQPLVQRTTAPAELPLALVDVKTSASGYQIAVNETAPPGLTLNRGVTDQFIQSTEAVSKVSMPFDAFMHSNKDAVIKLQAKQADDAPLPKWVQFDPATGVFEVTPPKGFKGKLDVKVVARDDDGREATAIFQMFVGEQQSQDQAPVNRPQGRSSFSEKLRLAGKRPVTLVRVSDAASRPMVHESVVRVRAG